MNRTEEEVRKELSEELTGWLCESEEMYHLLCVEEGELKKFGMDKESMDHRLFCYVFQSNIFFNKLIRLLPESCDLEVCADIERIRKIYDEDDFDDDLEYDFY